MKILGHGATIPEARASAGGVAGLVISWVPPIEELRPITGVKPVTSA